MEIFEPTKQMILAMASRVEFVTNQAGLLGSPVQLLQGLTVGLYSKLASIAPIINFIRGEMVLRSITE